MRRVLLRALVTIAIVGGACALFVPGLLRRRISDNETRMIGTMNLLATAQEQFKQATIRDGDGDGTGEYGFLQHLSDRGFCGPEFAASAGENGGDVVLHGYRFRMFLPLADGSPRREMSPPPTFMAVDADNQETNWVCYAWPESLKVTGNRSGVINQEGQFYQCPNSVHGWSGESGAALGSEAFSDPRDMTSPIVIGAPSSGGETWTSV